MIRQLLIIFFMSFSFNVVCNDIVQIQVTHNGNSTIELVPGDVVSLRLHVWPRELLRRDLKGLFEGKYLISQMYISEVLRKEISLNNSDVYEVDVIAVVTDNFDSLMTYKFKNENDLALVTFKKIKTNKSKKVKLIKQYHVLSQDVHSKFTVPFYVFLSITIILIVFGYFYGKYFKRKRAHATSMTRLLVEKGKIKQMVESAETRGEIENIYLQKDKVAEALDLSLVGLNDLWLHIDEVQYKEVWTDHEYQKIVRKLDIVKEEIKNDIFK